MRPASDWDQALPAVPAAKAARRMDVVEDIWKREKAETSMFLPDLTA
jgi:hypothetical protein